MDLKKLPSPEAFAKMGLKKQQKLLEKLRVRKEFQAPKDQRVFTAAMENKIKKQPDNGEPNQT